VPWTVNSNGVFRTGNIKTSTKNKCKTDNDKKYIQAILDGNGYSRNGKNFYLTRNGKNVAHFTSLGLNGMNGMNGGISFPSSPSSQGITLIQPPGQLRNSPMNNNPSVIVMPAAPSQQRQPDPQVIYMPSPAQQQQPKPQVIYMQAPPQPTPPPQIVYVHTPPPPPQVIYMPSPQQQQPIPSPPQQPIPPPPMYIPPQPTYISPPSG
jgi:hypothetical protein